MVEEFVYTEPKDLQEAYERRRDLVKSIQLIELQLGNKERRRMEGASKDQRIRQRYTKWRLDAQWSLVHMADDLRRINRYIATQRKTTAIR
jgi:hypothetical protein